MINANHTTCDVCGAVKGETNHWIVASQVDNMPGIIFVPADSSSVRRDIAHVKVQDICGQACATKRLSQFFSTI